MSDRIPLMAGNWKMNLDHLQATHLVQKLDWSLKDGKHDFAAVEVAVLPPFTDLRSVQTLVQGDRLELSYGAQDLSEHDSGAYTGDISGAFLAKLGCSYVVVGHSERRQYHEEDDEAVAAKLRAALRHGLVPIFCVGEPIEVRQAHNHLESVVLQVETAIDGLEPEQVAQVVIAYEPVWAIGSGESASPENAQEVCAVVREAVAHLANRSVADAMRIIYGGSVKPGSVAQIMAQDDIDGALVGGASTTVEDFSAICRYRQHHGAS